jgi:hypothetical protein
MVCKVNSSKNAENELLQKSKNEFPFGTAKITPLWLICKGGRAFLVCVVQSPGFAGKSTS